MDETKDTESTEMKTDSGFSFRDLDDETIEMLVEDKIATGG